MLDIKLIRENPEKINELLKRRNPELSIDTIIAIDADRRKVQAQADELRAKRKSESQKIGMMKKLILNFLQAYMNYMMVKNCYKVIL